MKNYKFRIYPSKSQMKEMNTHRWIAKNLWNNLLQYCKETYEKTGKFPTKSDLQGKTKDSGLYSQSSQNVSHKIHNAMVRYFKAKKKNQKAGFPRFKNMDRLKSIYYPQSGFWLNDKLKVSPFGELNIRKHREIKGVIKTLTLKREATGKWFAIFCAEQPTEPIRENTGERVGIDLGLITFAHLSNGQKIINPHHIKIYEDKLAFYQRELANKKKGSSNRRKAKYQVAKIHERLANARLDFLHKTSTKLVNSYSLIALEKLASQEMAMQGHGKNINDAGWGMFANMIAYKAESAGCKAVFVNPKNTSKECSACGKLVNKTLWDRQHNCPCGLSIDRDLNASINILTRATAGIAGSNACEDGAIVPSMKQEAITLPSGRLG